MSLVQFLLYCNMNKLIVVRNIPSESTYFFILLHKQIDCGYLIFHLKYSILNNSKEQLPLYQTTYVIPLNMIWCNLAKKLSKNHHKWLSAKISIVCTLLFSAELVVLFSSYPNTVCRPHWSGFQG